MASVTVKVDGVGELVIDLRALVNEMADLKVMQSIATEAASIAADAAPKRTGRLASSIRGNKAKSKAVVTAGYARRVPYAGPINYGWPRRNIRAANFMQAADKAMEPRLVPILESAITKIIKQKGLS